MIIAFAKNLSTVRQLFGWSQEKTAEKLKVNRPAYAAWEEGRSFPSATCLIRIAKTFKITDLIGFIENEHFNYRQQLPKAPEIKPAETLVEQKYREAGIREKLAVNILLGLVDVDEN